MPKRCHDVPHRLSRRGPRDYLREAATREALRQLRLPRAASLRLENGRREDVRHADLRPLRLGGRAG
jgi:hypothetical protein